MLRPHLDAAIQMFGQIVYVNGEKVAQIEFATPADIPFGFIAIPQYATERILREELAMHGVQVERGMRLAGFEQDADGVTATLDGDGGEQTVRARYLDRRRRRAQHRAQDAWADVRRGGVRGAVHARRRRGRLVGAAGLGVRSMHQADGTTDDLLVCIPLPGRGRYRMSMLVPDDLGRHRPPATGSRTASRAPANRNCTTSRRCWTGCPPNRPPPETCAGPRCFGSATASSTPTAAAGCSSQAMPRTSTRRPERRA